jgi:hypothetical protein
MMLALSLLLAPLASAPAAAVTQNPAELQRTLERATNGYEVSKASRAFADVSGVDAMRARVTMYPTKMEMTGGVNLRDWLVTGMNAARDLAETEVLVETAAKKKTHELLRLVCLRALQNSNAPVPAKPLLSRAWLKAPVEINLEWQRTLGQLWAQGRLALKDNPPTEKAVLALLRQAGPPFGGLAKLTQISAADSQEFVKAIRKAKSSGDRAEAVRGLAKFVEHRTLWIEAATFSLNNPSAGPRVAVLDMAKEYRVYPMVPILIDALAEEFTKGGRFIEDYASTLRFLTNRQFGIQVATWQNWWDKEGQAFLAKPPEPKETARPIDEESTTARMFGIPVDSLRIGIVVDGSGSMNTLLDNRTRAEAAADEVESMLSKLPDKTLFQVTIIERTSQHCFSKSVVAKSKNIKKAADFVRRFSYRTVAAMHDVLVETQRNPGVDTLLFISDGGGSWGSYAYPGHMEKVLKAEYERTGVRIHCIFVGKDKNKRRFMSNLASLTSGILVAPAE